MGLTRHEMETVIVFNEAEPFARIETANSRLKRKLAKLSEENAVITPLSDEEPFQVYQVPKRLVTISKPRK